MIRAAVFDFDGVVLESADIKTLAFGQLFDGNEEAVAYHLAHQGVSRYKKFEIITSEILRRPYDDAERRRLDERFTALVFEQVIACPFVPGAQELLERRASELPLFVASGTPQEELRTIVAARGLDGVFSGVYGTPPTKGEILVRILEQRGLRPREVVMVGDATTDLIGARDAGVQFVGRVPAGAPDPFVGEDVPVVSDLGELDRRWNELLG